MRRLPFFAPATLAAVLAGCSLLPERDAERVDLTATTPADSSRAGYEAARARWDAAGPAGYTMTYAVTCYCGFAVPGPYTVSVEGGRVVRAVGRDGRPLGEGTLTVDRLFGEVDRALGTQPAYVAVRYHTVYGFPVEASLGNLAVDAGVHYAVTRFAFR